MKTTRFRLLIIPILAILLVSPIIAETTVNDLLLYFDTEREPPALTVYNPTTDEYIRLPSTIDLGIRTSSDGRIAYIQDNDVWVLDVLNSPYEPTQITHTPDEIESLIAWIPNASLLEFTTGGHSNP